MCASKTVSRVLYLTAIYLDAPLPVRSSHPGSGRADHGARSPCSHTGVAPDRVYSDGYFDAPSGELLPRLSTLTSSEQTPYLSPRRHAARLPHSVAPPLPKRTALLGSFRSYGGQNREYDKEYGVCSDVAVSLCCTFPEVAFGGRYPLSLPCGARTFLTGGPFAPSARLSVFLAEDIVTETGEKVNTIQSDPCPWHRSW